MTKKTSKTILIVEDDKTQARTLQLLLESEGYNIVVTPSAEECLACLRKTRPDLILLDVIMPEMYGTELLTRLKRERGLRSIPIIAVTIVSPLAGIKEDIKRIDPKVGFLEKPYIKEDLLNIVKEHLRS